MIMIPKQGRNGLVTVHCYNANDMAVYMHVLSTGHLAIIISSSAP